MLAHPAAVTAVICVGRLGRSVQFEPCSRLTGDIHWDSVRNVCAIKLPGGTMRMHRPAHATSVAYVALFFAMSGAAVAATGGSLVLGHGNTAGKSTTLKNTGSGPALKLKNNTSSPPLDVGNNKKLVPGLNANYLGGLGKGAFVRKGAVPSGTTMNGVFSAGGANDTSTGYIGAGITYP